jgi:hypothetical protein
MSKFTALAIGLLTILAIAPESQALSTPNNAATVERPSADLHAQLIIKIGGSPEYHGDSYRRRQWEIEREREREARRRRREYYSKRYHRQNEYRVESRDEYRDNSNNDYRGNSNNDYRDDSRYSH